VNLNVDEAISDCLIIKFLLQPIIENAILHGLKLRKDDPVLNITGRLVNQKIEFIIKDNGPGFDAAELNMKLQSVHYDSSVGIFNVNNHIKLNFGKQYGIHVDSVIGEGTTVYVLIPKIDRKEIHEYYEHSDC
jgi:two-component system sensor histidine kinase YesM